MFHWFLIMLPRLNPKMTVRSMPRVVCGILGLSTRVDPPMRLALASLYVAISCFGSSGV